MLKNYFKVTFRNLIRHKGYSFINIAGLAVGIACSILIIPYIQYELSYDRFHEKADRIYRIGALKSIEEIYSGSPEAQTMVNNRIQQKAGLSVMKLGPAFM